jgi:precorrin-2/cobalt-factor-2 C20-methyltransferase
VRKTSVYLPDHLKRALAARAVATGRSEAEVVRAAIEAEVAARPGPGAVPAPEPPVRGRLVGVGVGPGDPDLLTVRAVMALRRADRVVAPATAIDSIGRAELVVRVAVPGVRVERVAFAMSPSRGDRDRSIDAAARTVASRLDDGEVAFVTLGDPLTYSTFSSVAAAVRRIRPETVVDHVPGIMAFQALAARAGTVVADESQRVVVRTALTGDGIGEGIGEGIGDGIREDIAEAVARDLADETATVVLYKGGRRLPELAEAARRAGRLDDAVAGELLGMTGERVGPLADLAAAGPASYLATVIVPARAPS